MTKTKWREAYVVGSGPNGLTAAILLAKAGIPTTVLEAMPVIGGGTRSAEVTLPGFVHDVCSSVHPLAAASPVFASFPLHEHGLEWIHSPVPVAQTLEGGAAALYRSVGETAQHLGADGSAYRKAVSPLVRHWPGLIHDILSPVLRVPSHPLAMARFGARALWSAASTARRLFRHEPARALFAGIAAHSTLPLDAVGSSAFAWVLGTAAHTVGWPFPRGGAQRLADALASYFRSLGGTIVTGTRVRSLRDLSRSAATLILCDLAPKPFLEIAGGQLPDPFSRQLERYRYGPGAFKVDYALRSPIPWAAPECRLAATVHVGGSMDEMAASERAAAGGEMAARPYVLVTQPSVFDSNRAPSGRHTAWAYCHVPNGSDADMTDALESQIERFAPGFRACILARHISRPVDLERANPNLVGGDIGGGAQDLRQLVLRPTRLHHRTPLKGVYLCSSSTPPGAGVHGMCGFHAVRAALSRA